MVVCEICHKELKDKAGLAGHRRFTHPQIRDRDRIIKNEIRILLLRIKGRQRNFVRASKKQDEEFEKSMSHLISPERLLRGGK